MEEDKVKKTLDFDEPRRAPVGSNEQYTEHHPDAIIDPDKAEYMAYASKSDYEAAIELAKIAERYALGGYRPGWRGVDTGIERPSRGVGPSDKTYRFAPNYYAVKGRDISPNTVKDFIVQKIQEGDRKAEAEAKKYDESKELRAIASGKIKPELVETDA